VEETTMPDTERKDQPDGRELTRTDYWHIYDVLLKMIETDGNWIWQRWHYLLLANSFLFGAAGAIVGLQPAPSWGILALLSWAGMMLCVGWHLTAVHGGYYHDMWIRRARRIEERLDFGLDGPFTHGGAIAEQTRCEGHLRSDLLEEQYADVPLPWVWADPDVRLVKAKDITGTGIPLLFAFVWFVLLLVAFCNVLRGSCWGPLLGILVVAVTAVSLYLLVRELGRQHRARDCKRKLMASEKA
jgi:hypothetical protein